MNITLGFFRTCSRLACTVARFDLLKLETGQALLQTVLFLNGRFGFPLVDNVFGGVSVLKRFHNMN